MSELLAKVKAWVENSGEADQSVGSANDQVESLTNAVEQTNLETTERNPYLEFEDMMESWTVKGAAGDTCPRTLMGTACSVTTHTPAPGKGYFVLPGDKLQAGLTELIKSNPAQALRGEKGCGYQGCKSSFFESIGAFNDLYPRETEVPEQREAPQCDLGGPRC